MNEKRFNPYSTGFSSFINDKGGETTWGVTFQSLFYWILFFYKDKLK